MALELSEVDDEIYSCLDLSSLGSFFLFAGAGSGKTGSLVRVLQKFREENIRELKQSGKKVAIITFTNAACDEIKRRLDFDAAFNVSTIHSFCWSLIQTYQQDIKDWVRINTEQELQELEEAQRRGRAGTKAALEREVKIAQKQKRLSSLDSIRVFSYNPNGLNSGRDSLNHAEVIKIASEFLGTKKLMKQLLVLQYPILFIDESQDTKKELIEALLKIQPDYQARFCLGLFGDTMQRIYSDGKLDLGENLPADWKKPEKTINYRCPKRVITLINDIRGSQHQTPGDSNGEGEVRLFVVDANDDINKLSVENSIADKMSTEADDVNWCDAKAVKVLTLEHKMAARRGGFDAFFQPLYDHGRDTTGLIDGSMAGASFFVQRLLPLVSALRAEDDFLVADLMKKYSPLLDKKRLRQAESALSVLKQANESVAAFKLLWGDGNDPALLEVVDKIQELGLFELPDVLLPIVLRDDDALENEDEEDDKNPDVEAWESALAAPYSQLEAYGDYVSDRSRFGTHQGVKGLEFPRVMVVLDDDEAGGFLFSYEKLFGAKEPSQTDLRNIAAGKETTIDRTKRLFYVTCSRAEKSLAVVAYTKNPQMVRDTALGQGWFREEEIIMDT